MCPTIVSTGVERVVTKQAGREQETRWHRRAEKETSVKFARYNRKRSNLLLITAGSSSAVPPDGEEDSSSGAKFSLLSPLIKTRCIKKCRYLSLWDDPLYGHTHTGLDFTIHNELDTKNLQPATAHTVNNTSV